MRQKSVLVIFGKESPEKSKKWFEQFDKIISPKELEGLIDPGSVQEAYDLVNKISRLTLADGSRLAKLINWQGYELWWLHFDTIYERFCLPYTQYSNLLSYLKNFKRVYLFQPPYPDLFSYFLRAHQCQCIILKKFKLRNLLPIPFGVLVQAVLSILFLPWLAIKRPGIMVWTSDKFSPPHDYDFRMKFIYKELRKRKIPFVEFIRSMESWRVVLQHAWKRKRPVFYSTAITCLIGILANLVSKKKRFIEASSDLSRPEDYFWFSVATHYIKNIKATIWSILAMKFVLQWIGVKAAIIGSGVDRTFHEVLGCKVTGIKTVGIEHGAASRYYFVSDFMPEFNGEKMISVDRYGLWSDWWKEYYIKNSKVFKPEQLFVSGPMRPLEKEIVEVPPSNPPRILFISEELAAPKEIIPYLLTILDAEDFDLYFKFRPYRDGFEIWLKENQPEIYGKISAKTKILRGTMEEAIGLCDIVVGSYSTAVLEALLQVKPFVFFQTQKWGDAFEIKKLDIQGHFFAENPQELAGYIKSNLHVPREELIKLQKQFFGNPYQDGGKWVVEQALEFAKNYDQRKTV